jgi:hypothetical protein
MQASINKIVGFAEECHTRFTERLGMDTACDVCLRVDLLVFVSGRKRDEKGDEVDTSEPLLVLNELDVLDCPLLYLDFYNPERQPEACKE